MVLTCNKTMCIITENKKYVKKDVRRAVLLKAFFVSNCKCKINGKLQVSITTLQYVSGKHLLQVCLCIAEISFVWKCAL